MAEELFKRQGEILQEIERIHINFGKDSAIRKTADYLKKRLDALEILWREFDTNNTKLQAYEDKTCEYFSRNIYQEWKVYFEKTKTMILSFKQPTEQRPKTKFHLPVVSETTEIENMVSQQGTNFRAFERLLNRINMDTIEEKWEIEDELKNLKHLWINIDSLHLRIDNILQGSDEDYEHDFATIESQYMEIKRDLHQKLSSSEHLRQSTPQIDVPIFLGKYTQWPTFYDLFTETIHNSKFLTKTQKMQHLKSKVKGEAERLIQHLNITAENYETAWNLLTGRYNNPLVLFTTQIEIFLNQSVIQKQTSFELKRLYDTTMECIHAIHNLGIDTSTWDPLLVHLVAKKLDTDTFTDYKESRSSPRSLPVFDDLMSFIEKKFMALEPIQRKAKESSPPVKQPVQQHQKYNYTNYNQRKSFPRNYQAVATSYKQKCLMCDLDHELYQCKRFLNQPTEAIMKTIAKLQVCQNCLYKHIDTICPSSKKCKKCSGDHNTIIHDAAVYVPMNSKNVKPMPTAAPTEKPSSSNLPPRQHNVNYVASENEEILLTTLSLDVKGSDGSLINFRALLDQGSQVSLISESAAQLLGLRRQQYQASISGIGTSSKQSKGIVSLECHSIYGDYQLTTEALIVSRVINNLPSVTLPNNSWEHLQHTRLADPEYHVSKPIDILLDASVYSEIIMSGLVKGTHQSPIAQQTKLGWILSGHVRTFTCNVAIKTFDDIKKYWEVEDINESSETLTADEQYCEDLFQTTTKRLEDGRYEVAIPMKPGFEKQLGHSKAKATAQFIQQERRMAKNSSLSEGYKKFMHEYEQLGHMRPAISQDLAESVCYLPHHGVINLGSTTSALRIVFNASSKTSSGLSLNDMMERGPNLQKDLQSLILKWRQFKYVITADIEKMFRQILVRETDQHLQTIIWRDSPRDLLREYHLTTVTYGTKAAPFLAMRTLKQIGRDSADTYKLAAAALEHSFYMDDLLAGSDSLDQAKLMQAELTTVLKEAGMNLRKWSSNDSKLIKDLPADLLNAPFEFKDSETRKTLGLQWNSSSDTFAFAYRTDCDTKTKPLTKRQLLSDIAKIYDPMGWITPITIKAKILFQKTWSLTISWDDELPEVISNDWLQIREDLGLIPKFAIPRHLGDMNQSFQIHGFCDSSEKSYACSIYLVTLNHKGEYTSRLIAAKSKVAPHNKVITLPRLELLGALLLSQLMKKFLDTVPAENFTIYAWTDSMVVLGWLHGNASRWKQFVANRVNEIKKVIPTSSWHHVKSAENAADCATRGLSAAKLLEHRLWWEGPEWLLSFNPTNIESKTYPDPTLEIKRTSVNTALLQNQDSFINELLNKNSSITRVVKITAWVLRFVARLRNTQVTTHGSALTLVELQYAHNLIIKNVQSCDFTNEITQLKKKALVSASSHLSSLKPFLDEQGVLRVGGRLEHADITYSAKHPVILTSKNRLTELIIHQAHLTTLHGGPRLTLSFIREKYWILSGIRTVKKQIRLCTKCRRYSQEHRQQIMADLPGPRVTPSRPFTNVGVDFTGHVEIKANKGRGIRTSKGYIAVFVCLVTKAVHLELVSDLSTSAFLAALRRMCARRGTPSNMYSDNGTNFIGAARLLKSEYLEIIQSINTDVITDITSMGINWHFNAPAWPNAGGLWEAAVKGVKFHLKRILGEQKLTYEEFITLLHQIEACLNSRPLCSLTESSDDYYLTPGHFLIGGSLLSRPQTEPDNVGLSTRWRLIQSLNKQFWKKWSNEYLQQLQTRAKWRTPQENLKVDDVVIIKEDNQPPGKWAMGRVQEIHPGKDGHVRVVTLKTQNNVVKRPVNKLVLLPVNNNTTERPPDSTKLASSTSTPGATQELPERSQRARGNTFKGFFTAALIFMSLLSPSVQQTSASFNIKPLNGSQHFYFDKISDLQHIRDEWKLIVYYNMSSFWQGVDDINLYITHLKKVCRKMYSPQEKQYEGVILQLEHQLNEIIHYNQILKFQNRRHKRGLINGVGNAASYLFGVLDDKFAEQYKKDIEKTTINENHLQNLIRNQTLVVESEYNILRRHERIVDAQFHLLWLSLRNVSSDINHTRLDNQKGLFITSSTLSASIILTNLRSIQQSLIDTITDVTHGRIDTHLLSPEQLETQVNTITRQLQGDLIVPDKDNIRDLYKILRVFAKVIDNYLIMEFKIPLITNEVYELDKIISLPFKKDSNTYRVNIRHPYLAFNLRKDIALLLTQQDLQTCIHASLDNILCPIDKPIYDMKARQSICDLKMVNMELNQETPCILEQSTCGDKWIKLQHTQNDWLYACCEECTVRILCPADTEIRTLSGNGLLSLGQGCTLKGTTFTIFSHKNFLNRINTEAEKIEPPKMSILNSIMRSNSVYNATPPVFEQHQSILWDQLGAQIADLKEQASTTLTVHDVHQYIISYSLVGMLTVAALIVGVIWIKKRRLQQTLAVQEIPVPQPRTLYRRTVDKSTSPREQKTVKFELPKFSN